MLAEQIEGHIGDKDVEFLVHYVDGGSSNSENVKVSNNGNNANSSKVPGNASSTPGNGSNKKKSNNFNGKEPRKRTVTDGGSIPNGDRLEEESRENSPVEPSSTATKFNKYPFTKSESLDSPAVSPSQAPSIASCVEYGAMEHYSDDGMEYHSDREAGFVPYTRRRKVRGQSQKLSLHTIRSKARSVGGNSSFASAASSPLSITPSVISASSMSGTGVQGTSGTTCRGYESEREYYNEDRKQGSRRKAVSSMPHSEQNSPENSDVDSSLSLPTAAHHRISSTAAASAVQKVSYAKMAAGSNNIIINPKLELSDNIIVVESINPIENVNASTSNIKPVDHGHVLSTTITTTITNCDLKSTPPSNHLKKSTHHQSICNKESTPPLSFIPHNVQHQLTQERTNVGDTTRTLTDGINPNNPINHGTSDESSNLPPVIMEGIPDTVTSGSFTFGFFDDIVTPDSALKSSVSTSVNPVAIPKIQVTEKVSF